MIDFIRDTTKAVFSFAKLRLEKVYYLIKNEGFSSGFTRLLIVFISIGSSLFGSLVLMFLLPQMGFHQLNPLLRWLAGIFYTGDIVDLMIRSFIILHLPAVILIIVQKIITRNLIKKYRDKESDLIKP
jgi:hypothetical protein